MDFRAPRPPAEPRQAGPGGAAAAAQRHRRRSCTAAIPTTTCSRRRTHWDEVTRRVVRDRVDRVPPFRFFDEREQATLDAPAATASPRRTPSRGSRCSPSSTRSSTRTAATATSYFDMPSDRRRLAHGRARPRRRGARARRRHLRRALDFDHRAASSATGSPRPSSYGGAWATLNVARAFGIVMRDTCEAFYSHPWAWNEIGFGGPAYPRGYAAFGSPELGEREHWEGVEAFERRPGARRATEGVGLSAVSSAQGVVRHAGGQRLAVPARQAQAGPAEPAPMARHSESAPVDLVVVGAGAGRRHARAAARAKGLADRRPREGPVLGSRPRLGLRREGLRRALLDDNRIIGGTDPIEMGKNNSGVGVGGSMTHFAGYVPRFHPSDFEVRTRDGVAADWPISYRELKESFERVERELPVAGEHWPWGDPHDYPHAPHPVVRRGAQGVGGSASVRHRDAGRAGLDHERQLRQPAALHLSRLLPAGLQGEREGVAARSRICPTRSSTASRCGPTRWRRASRSTRSGRARGVVYVHDGQECFQPADAVAVCGYAIESPRLLLNSTSARFPRGLANNDDQVGRYVMVQGATQVAARFPEMLRMYKAPPPEISSRAVLRDGRVARLRARLLDPDDLAAADRLGRARDRRGPLGPRAPRVHARLQPLDGARLAVRAAAAGREPRHALRRNGSLRRTGRDVPVTASARTTRRTSPTRRR